MLRIVNTIKMKLDYGEWQRKVKRQFDVNLSYRKLFVVIVCFAVIGYLLSSLSSWLTSPESIADTTLRCMDDRLTPFYRPHYEFNANIRHSPILPQEKNYVPYIGNGIFGLEVHEDAHLHVKSGRSLQLSVFFHPIVSVAQRNGANKEATVVDYLNGIVHRYQCFENNFFVAYQYYAHRKNPSVFVQEIEITNLKNQLVDVEIVLPRISDWPTAVTQTIKLQHGSNLIDYQVVTGLVEAADTRGNVVAVAIVSHQTKRLLTLKKRGTTKLEILMTINYSKSVARAEYAVHKDLVERQAIDAMKQALGKAEHDNVGQMYYVFKRQHTQVWNALWSTGFHISNSKAEHSINGDQINATIYAVLSQVRAYEFEDAITADRKAEIARSLSYAEGCYDSYHTLQASNLWRTMGTVDELQSVVASWLLTLEKQGCHNLIRAGASGIVQALVLSFGGFRFSNQHLEFNIHPKFLHRDFGFRRLNYGNMTHVNVTVTVTDDNKAIIEVALDRSDRSYYACDGGCLDEPVPLGPSKKTFPVKLTEPFTSILYITSDKQHIEELRHAIHVKEVVEAPAHEHHVIALHKHGHHLGGLPTFFWVSICAIIIVFHVFLCKLIVKEYCEPPDKMRYRCSKP